MQYRIVHEKIKDTAFYSFAIKDSLFVLVVNPAHPFYRKIYKPLIEDGGTAAMEFRGQIDLLLLSCARAEASATKKAERAAFAKLRSLWSDNLATFLNG